MDKFLIPACGAFNWSKVESLSQNDGELGCSLYYSLGLHPYFTDKHTHQDIDVLANKLANRPANCVAVGECGLDFSIISTESQLISEQQKSTQIELFSAQIELANQFKLPLIMHCRKAQQEMVKTLRKINPTYGGVVHGFAGSEQQAHDFIQLGLSIGVGGTITYSRAQKTRQTIASLPLNALVLETDSPDMPLHGFQGEANRPALVKNVLDTLSSIRPEPFSVIAKQVYQNSLRLFSIPK